MDEVFQIRRDAAIEQLRSDGWLASVEWFKEVDSTNNFLHRELTSKDGHRLPRLAVADQQTAGRGRGDNAWWSPDGCLMFSIAWRPDQCPEIDDRHMLSRMSQLPLVVGVSIASTLRTLVPDRESIRVKWPNDVYLSEKKLAGILIENIIGASDPFWIIGVGINAAVDFTGAPEPIRSKATSLHREVSSEARASLCVETLLISILSKLQETLAIWQRNLDFLQLTWSDYCLLNDRWVRIRIGNESVQGTCTGIDDRGALVILDPSGRSHTILSGVVESWT